MPLNRTPLTGNQIVAMANVSLQRDYSFPAPGANPSINTVNEINVLGLPSLMYHITLNSPVAGVIFTPLFSVQNITTGGVTAPNWVPFTNGALLVPGNVFVFSIRAAVGQAAAEITIPAGGGPTAVRVIITAGG